MFPMQKVTAFDMPPMHRTPIYFFGIVLKKNVIFSVELNQPVRVVYPTFLSCNVKCRSNSILSHKFLLCRPANLSRAAQIKFSFITSRGRLKFPRVRLRPNRSGYRQQRQVPSPTPHYRKFLHSKAYLRPFP